MCGRFSRQVDIPVISARWQAEPTDRTPLHLAPDSDIRPRTEIPVIALGADRRRKIIMARWGLVPPDAETEKPKFSAINARADKLNQAPIWRRPFNRGRTVLVPANGYFEWAQTGPDAKQQYLFRMADSRPFLLAGLWESWRPPAAAAVTPPLISCTLITVQANETGAKIHDRMPAIIDDSLAGLWLGDEPADEAAKMTLLKPYPAARMTIEPYWPQKSD